MGNRLSYEALEKRVRELERACAEAEREKEGLEQHRVFFCSAIQSLPFDFFAIGKDGRYFIQNSACKARWGDITGKRPEDLPVPEGTKVSWMENNSKAFSGETVASEWADTFGGEKRFFYNIVSPIHYGKDVNSIVGINIDVTDYRHISKSFRIRDKIIKSSLNAIAIADLEGKLTYVNPAFLTMWDYESDAEVIGRSCLEFWKTRSDAQEVIEAALEREAWSGELVAKKKKAPGFLPG